MQRPDGVVRFEPVSFAALDGWAQDDHAAALRCFLRSADILAESVGSVGEISDEARRALAGPSPGEACRTVLEQAFTPHRIVHSGTGFVTGYYEPVLTGSRARSPDFHVPLYRRPDDLVTLVDDALRGSVAGALTHARRTADALVPFATRREIEHGALAGQGLELCWLADPVDAFFLQVQGSGVLELVDEGTVRVGYDGKNGHPYTSVGKVLIAAGEIAASEMSLDTLRAWLAADRDRAREMLWHNASFVFFRERAFVAGEGPLGVRDITLTAGRSLAVDASVHRLGLPIHVSVPGLAADDGTAGFQRLMIAQDVGSAITGAERGDIFFGTGDAAGARAGATRHAARFHVLLPRGASLP